MDRDREVLVIRGHLDRAGHFRLRRSRSTDFVRQWPIIEHTDVYVELLDADRRVVHREPAEVKAEVTCDPGAPRRARVLGYIALRGDAASVRLRRQELDLWEAPIQRAPDVKVEITTKRIARERPLQLDLRYSPAGKDAHLTVVYKWGSRKFRPIYIGPPSETMEIDLTGLPGGDACQLVVSYSNGLRSAQAATGFFAVPPRGPQLAIVRPTRRDEVVAGTPVILEASAIDDERGASRRDDALVWLVDEKEVGRGLIASVDGLSPGRHRVTLEYRVTPPVRAEVIVVARHSKTALANDWPEWDPFARRG